MIHECIATMVDYLHQAEERIKILEEEIIFCQSQYSYYTDMAISQLRWLTESGVIFTQS